MLSAPRLTRFVFGALVCCAALFQTGCAGRYTGGGFIDSVVGAPQKATFGFNIEGRDLDGDGLVDVARGQFQYNDHGAGVSFHVDVTGWTGAFLVDGNVGELTILYDGTYSSNAGSGDVFVAVGSTDDGPPGGPSNPADYVFVAVNSGPYAGYVNFGVVQGGNIEFHPPH